MDVASIVATSIWAIIPLAALGSLLHFGYDWSRHHRVMAVIGAVNESYWEHIKIAVWPVAVLQVALFALGGWQHLAFVPAAAVALYSIPVTMVGIVFLYKSVTRRNVLWLDIAAFVVTIVAAQGVFALVVTELEATWLTVAIAATYLAGLIVAFLTFTLRPPSEPDLFVDPLTGRYGRPAHRDSGAEPAE